MDQRQIDAESSLNIVTHTKQAIYLISPQTRRDPEHTNLYTQKPTMEHPLVPSNL